MLKQRIKDNGIHIINILNEKKSFYYLIKFYNPHETMNMNYEFLNLNKI